MFNKLCTEGAYLNMIQVIYDKPTGNITLKGVRLKFFSSKIILITPIQHSSGGSRQSNQGSKRKKASR